MKPLLFKLLAVSQIIAVTFASDVYSLKNKCDEVVFRGAEDYLVENDSSLACPEDSCKSNPAKIKTYLDASVNVADSAYNKFLASPLSAFYHNPWRLSKMTHSTYREMGVVRIFANTQLKTHIIDPKDDLKTANNKMLDSFSLESMLKFEKEEKPFGPDNEKIIKMLTVIGGYYDGESGIKANFLKILGICTLFSPANAVACNLNLNRLVLIFTSGDDYAVGEPYLKDILTSSKVARGARRAAEKIFKKYLDKKTGGDLFSDVYSAFLEEGFKDSEAKKWTWDLIYLSFLHGQNGYTLAQSYRNKSNFWTFRSALLISSTAVYLDSLNMEKNGKMYSIPEQIEVSCDNGKPYHFWVPAYAARESRSLGFSKTTSKSTSFLLDLGYQLFSSSEGRNPEIYLAEGVFGSTNLKNRLDLSYAAAGVEFGIKERKVKFSVDESFDNSINKKFRQVKKFENKKELVEPLNLFLMMNPWTILNP